MAIQAIGKISVRIGSQANICVDTLLALLNMEIDHITSETVTTMTSKFIVRTCEVSKPLWLLVCCVGFLTVSYSW